MAQMPRLADDEIEPALFSEEPETIRLALKHLGSDPEKQKMMQAAGIKLLTENFQADPPIPQLKEKLRVLGLPENILSKLN